MQHATQLQPGHRAVMPLDMEEIIASAPLRPEPDRAVAMETLLDPVTGKALLHEVPANVAATLRDAFHRQAKHGAQEQCEGLRRSLAQSNKIASDLRSALDDAQYVGVQLRTLMYMFLQTMESSDKDMHFSASHLVMDIAETMAKRLDGINERAGVLYEPLRARFQAA